MLHIESWPGGKKSVYSIVLLLVIAVIVIVCCKRKIHNTNNDISVEAFSELRTPVFTLSGKELRSEIIKLCKSGAVKFSSDRFVSDYYLNNGHFVWIGRNGVTATADTLLAYLECVGEHGFSAGAFFVDTIRNDLQRVRSLRIDSLNNTVCSTYARLEYHLTKAYLRYVLGFGFGFTNPDKLFNRLDTVETKEPRRFPIYKKLYDIETTRPDSKFVRGILMSARNDSIRTVLQSTALCDSFYVSLRNALAGASEDRRRMLLCNMERCRWKMKTPFDIKQKCIVVNVPAFHLYTFGTDSAVDMKVVCGSRSNKTPLLVSCINRMDVNPVWNIPQSIVRHDVLPHAGDTSYFARNHYFVVERKTGERISLEEITAEMLESGDFRVVQEGGEWNSLGRIVFRFPNNFSVFLHDTPTKRTFSRTVRSASHGCVRVEKPYELAEFLLAEKDEWTLDKLRISMGMEPRTTRGMKYVSDKEDITPLVKSLYVKPCVQLFILYFTLWKDFDGELKSFPDIYGYDSIIYENIKPLTD